MKPNLQNLEENFEKLQKFINITRTHVTNTHDLDRLNKLEQAIYDNNITIDDIYHKLNLVLSDIQLDQQN